MNKDAMEFRKANQIALFFGNLIKNGIRINDTVLPCTILDYYSLVKDNPDYVVRGVKSVKLERSYYESMYKNAFIGFAVKTSLFFHIVEDANEIVEQHHVFIINGERVVLQEEEIQEILDLLDANNIPKYDKVVYVALTRKAHNYPILPLLNSEELVKTCTK